MTKKTQSVDTIIIGAGAAGLFAGLHIAQAGKKVVILEHANKPGKKILMSGGGRCNFTNYHAAPDKYLSHNPHFCKSALARYTQWDFLALIEKHGIKYHEKELGQLFCDNKAKDILNMLLKENERGQSQILLKTTVNKILYENAVYCVESSAGVFITKHLIIATGGLSIPTMGASDFGYQVAQQFKLEIYPTRAGLVPFVFNSRAQKRLTELAGVSLSAQVSHEHTSFTNGILFTHQGISGPAILQISSYWQPGDKIEINFLPGADLNQLLQDQKATAGSKTLKTILGQWLPKKLIASLLTDDLLDKKVGALSNKNIEIIKQTICAWQFYPETTEGYRTAEVTLGGINVDQISSKTMEVKKQPGLYFIGEVLDVTGWLGGYNFQWAWSSAWVAANAIISNIE